MKKSIVVSPKFPAETVESIRTYLWLTAERLLDGQTRRRVSPSDIVQETFLEAHRDFPQFRGEGRTDLQSWLRRILQNNVRNAQRAARAKKRNVSQELPTGETEGFVAQQKSPSSIVAFDEEFALLETAMQQLSEDYRVAINCRSLQRLSFAETGRRLNRSEDAARKLWFRAIQALEKTMAHLRSTSNLATPGVE